MSAQTQDYCVCWNMSAGASLIRDIVYLFSDGHNYATL